jgi:RNA polymerase sigma factor (sigma-70 family)
VIDSREKLILFEETIAANKQMLSFIARNNAPVNDWQDLRQEILLAFWKSLDNYDGERSGLGTWLYSVAKRATENFKRKDHNRRKRDVVDYSKPAFVEQDGDQNGVIEEFTRKLGALDRQVFKMYLEDYNYAEISEALRIEEVNLRKRVSRVIQHLKADYKDYKGYKDGTR